MIFFRIIRWLIKKYMYFKLFLNKKYNIDLKILRLFFFIYFHISKSKPIITQKFCGVSIFHLDSLVGPNGQLLYYNLFKNNNNNNLGLKLLILFKQEKGCVYIEFWDNMARI